VDGRHAGLLAIVAVGACARPVVPPTTSPRARQFAPLVLERPVLPEEAVLEARVDGTISTWDAKPGRTYTAAVMTPIRDTRGRMLLEDARVILRVERARRGKGARPPILELEPVALRTRCGEQPLQAWLAQVNIEQISDEPNRELVREGATGGLYVGSLFGLMGVFVGGTIASWGGLASAVARNPVEGQLSGGSIIKVEIDEALRLPELMCGGTVNEAGSRR
jgi:hypothetical protein